MTETYDIYFNDKKEAFAYEIKNYTCTIKSDLWEKYAGTDEWDIIDGVFTDITDTLEYKEKKKKEERERIGNLTCTKRVFVLMLEELGYDYFEQIQPLIESNRQASLEWELCSSLQRNNSLIDTVAFQLGITSGQLDKLFQYANNEITLEDFKNIQN